nr:hypothetical protein [Candidatus Sigynarchaeum springense]
MLTNPSLLDPTLRLNFGIGAAFAAVLFPAGYKIFKWGFDKSKKEGALGWF